MELAQGEWEGLTHAEVRSRWGSELEAWRRDPVHNHAPGGESLDEGAARVGTALETILDGLCAATPAPGATMDPVLGYATSGQVRPWALVVAHDGILRLLLMSLLGIPIEHYWSFPFALCAVSVVDLAGGRPRMRAHNLAEHLDVLAGAAQTGPDRGGAL